MDEIRLGTFDLVRYFPEYRFIDKLTEANEPAGRSFEEWVKVWSTLSSRELEHSTLAIYKRHLAAYWTPVFGQKRATSITHEQLLTRLAELNEAGLSRKTQNNVLIPLRGVLGMMSRTVKCPNPADGIENLKVQTGKPDPFTLEEVEAILKALLAESDVVRDYFEFSFFTGLRMSEQIALLWPDVDLRSKVFVVRRARVMGQDKERTKTAVERQVELNERAAATLERQRARTQLAGAHVFINPFTRHAWHDGQTQHKLWTRALRKCGVRYRPPKEARDTSVTMSLMAGANPMWVAKQHGHSLQVMLKDYAKWIPDGDQGRNIALVNKVAAK